MAKTVYTKNGNATTKIDRTDTTKGGTAPAEGTRVNPDVTSAAQATGPYGVGRQDAATRLWQSLKSTYGDAINESNKAYQQNYVNADLQAQSRGMGRSSYNNQTLANINTEKANAANRLNSEMIAAYQQGLNALEQQQQEQANWQAQFDQSNQQFSQQMAMQYLSNILANNGNASDALLQQAGLSRKDFEAMRKQQATGGGGGGTGSVPAWKKAGFSSEAAYNNALAHGITSSTAYHDWLLQTAAQNATGSVPLNPNLPNLVNQYNQQQQQQSTPTLNDIFNTNNLPYHR